MSTKKTEETAEVASFTDAGEEIFQGEIVEYSHTEISTVTSIEQLIIDGPAALPDTLDGTLVLADWYYSLARGDAYKDPDPNAVMRKILLQTANAKSPEALFQRTKAVGLQELIPNRAGAGTGPINIDGLHVSESQRKGGVPCFMVLNITSRRTGETLVTSTGAQELQMQILGFLTFGIWPIECQIKRMDVTDKGGRGMFRLFPLD
jgi:hypothetical protein